MTVLQVLVDCTGRSEEEVLLGMAAAAALTPAVIARRTPHPQLEMWPLPARPR